MAALAADYRSTLSEVSAKYANTPGGAPPPELLEAIIHVESGGDPAARGPNDERGLALTSPNSTAWSWYLESPLMPQYGASPDILHDPRAAMEVLALEVDKYQESGLIDANAGGTGALQDWFMTALARKRLADNDGLRKTEGYEATTHYGDLVFYMDAQFGEETSERIDGAFPGALVNPKNGDPVTYDPTVGSDVENMHPKDPKLPNLNPAAGALDALKKLTAKAGEFGMRAGVFLVGIILAGLGAWFVFKGK